MCSSVRLSSSIALASATASSMRIVYASFSPGLRWKRAVRAGRGAHVRHVEVPVDVEVDDVAVLLGAHLVGQAAQPGQVVGLVQSLAVLAGQPLAGGHLLREL